MGFLWFIYIKICFPRLRIHKEAKKKKKNPANRKFRMLKITFPESMIGGGGIIENGVARIYGEPN